MRKDLSNLFFQIDFNKRELLYEQALRNRLEELSQKYQFIKERPEIFDIGSNRSMRP